MNLHQRLAALFLVPSFIAIAACGGPSSPSSRHASSGDPMSADGAMGDDGGTDSGASAPAAPTITMVMKMGGGLHVSWTNATKDCDTIVGERKTAADPYAVAFTVPGVADNKHDGLLTAGTTYTYRLHCVRGGLSSPFSNEMTGTP